MSKSRLIFFYMIVIALTGARVARAQDGVASLNDDIQNKYTEQEPEKAKPVQEKDKAKPKNNDGQRKHWWSLPHFHHKKKDESSVKQTRTAPKAAATNKKPVKHTTPTRRSAKSNPAKLAAAKPTHKTTTRNGNGGKLVSEKAHSNAHAKQVRHNCSPETRRKGGCQDDVPQHSAKTTARSS